METIKNLLSEETISKPCASKGDQGFPEPQCTVVSTRTGAIKPGFFDRRCLLKRVPIVFFKRLGSRHIKKSNYRRVREGPTVCYVNQIQNIFRYLHICVTYSTMYIPKRFLGHANLKVELRFFPIVKSLWLMHVDI